MKQLVNLFLGVVSTLAIGGKLTFNHPAIARPCPLKRPEALRKKKGRNSRPGQDPEGVFGCFMVCFFLCEGALFEEPILSQFPRLKEDGARVAHGRHPAHRAVGPALALQADQPGPRHRGPAARREAGRVLSEVLGE